jgi:hypothetical protein
VYEVGKGQVGVAVLPCCLPILTDLLWFFSVSSCNTIKYLATVPSQILTTSPIITHLPSHYTSCNCAADLASLNNLWWCSSVSIFSPEDGGSIFLRNVGIYRRVYMAPKPRRTSSSSLPWKPQVSHWITHLFNIIGLRHRTVLPLRGSDNFLRRLQVFRGSYIELWGRLKYIELCALALRWNI